MQMMLDVLIPHLTTWMERAFPTPVDIKADTFPSDPVVYLYLAQHNEALQFPAITLDRRKWDVWYVGETNHLRRRHLQHRQQVGTCESLSLGGPAVGLSVSERNRHELANSLTQDRYASERLP